MSRRPFFYRETHGIRVTVRPTYLAEPFLNKDGRRAYRAALLSAYDIAASIQSDFNDGGRLARIAKCLTSAIADIETFALGKGESL